MKDTSAASVDHDQAHESSVRADQSATIDLLRQEIEGLKDAFASRARIEQVKGALMVRYGLDQDQAFRVLVRWASLSNVAVRDVARVALDLLVDQARLAPPDSEEAVFTQHLKGVLSQVGTDVELGDHSPA